MTGDAAGSGTRAFHVDNGARGVSLSLTGGGDHSHSPLTGQAPLPVCSRRAFSGPETLARRGASAPHTVRF